MCPHCNISKLEKKTEEILKNNNILFNKQYSFDDCRIKRTLPFDFYLPQWNIAIECDGKQHYLYGCFGGDLLNLMNIKYRDTIKTNYCQQNNIKLIRIPYWEINNIENFHFLFFNIFIKTWPKEVDQEPNKKDTFMMMKKMQIA